MKTPKKSIIVLGIILLAGTIQAQAPQSFKYQAIARDTQGNIIAEQEIGLRISILVETTGGGLVYAETHNVYSNQFGLINLLIGKGNVEYGVMSDISWGTNEHFVKIEMDVNGGEDYVTMGVSQLLSVPYALYAEESGTSASLSTGASTGSITGSNSSKLGSD